MKVDLEYIFFVVQEHPAIISYFSVMNVQFYTGHWYQNINGLKDLSEHLKITSEMIDMWSTTNGGYWFASNSSF